MVTNSYGVDTNLYTDTGPHHGRTGEAHHSGQVPWP
jgi:hypothetical protein